MNLTPCACALRRSLVLWLPGLIQVCGQDHWSHPATIAECLQYWLVTGFLQWLTNPIGLGIVYYPDYKNKHKQPTRVFFTLVACEGINPRSPSKIAGGAMASRRSGFPAPFVIGVISNHDEKPGRKHGMETYGVLHFYISDLDGRIMKPNWRTGLLEIFVW